MRCRDLAGHVDEGGRQPGRSLVPVLMGERGVAADIGDEEDLDAGGGCRGFRAHSSSHSRPRHFVRPGGADSLPLG